MDEVFFISVATEFILFIQILIFSAALHLLLQYLVGRDQCFCQQSIKMPDLAFRLCILRIPVQWELERLQGSGGLGLMLICTMVS